MPADAKIRSLAELADVAARLRGEGQRIVQCHGVFDLLHIGHIRYLQKAKEQGDCLLVTVTADAFVNKGPQRPAFSEALRVAALAALECVDHVAISDSPTAESALRAIRPDIYSKGSEFRDHQTPELARESAVAAEIGAEIVYIEDVTSSSSQLINQYLSPFTDEVGRYLQSFRERHSVESIMASLARARALRVLVVGEGVIDEDYACQALAQSPKAPIVAARYESHSRYVEGALAAANHLAPFCGTVDLCALVGHDAADGAWIRSQLHPGIGVTLLSRGDIASVVRRRYRESYFGVPLFEVQFANLNPPSGAEAEAIHAAVADRIGSYDLVVVVDAGLGMMSPRVVETVCGAAKHLAVSAPLSAAGVGYLTIGKYPRADYAALAEQELRLHARVRSGDLKPLLTEVGRQLDARAICVTSGSHGCLCRTDDGQFTYAPALATKVVDRQGAGDAFFAITALAAGLGLPADVLAFLGNVAGAEAVSVVGNSRFLEPLPLTRHIQALLK